GGDKREGQTLGITVCPMRCVDTAEKTGKIVVCRDLGLSREVEKLRELDAMKDDFLSLITHELRTPLTSIMAYSEAMMLDETVENIPREWQEYIGVINSEGKRLCHLIDDTLDITRMRSGKMCYTFSEEDPNEIVGSAIMTYNSEIESKRLHLDLNLDEEIGQCRLIPERFLQAVKILVSNAVRYTNPDGRITISTKREAPSSGSDFPTLLLTVRDTGIGIAPENFERIFGDFEILEKVKHHTTGMGLSLAVCKQIIENGHKGSIWVESELNKGSSFFVRIPIK
ncbi:MAG: HAMP domain-containing histidine kinase, partial [Planctomycetota bacterium]|nr:HAMP domain-containing histidine kinase [Planctomycetota bacterium]